MASTEEIRNVISKISNYEDLGKSLCFFGGAMPYIMANQDSGRDHSDIDALILSSQMPHLREALKKLGLYDEKYDSKTFGLDRDYGIKAYISGIYVEFEPMEIKDNKLYRRSFSFEKKIAGEEVTPFEQITDLIIPIEVDGANCYSMSNEYIRAQKDKYRRPKDIADINFIDSQGVDEDKYKRAKHSFESREETLVDYSNKSATKNVGGEITE